MGAQGDFTGQLYWAGQADLVQGNLKNGGELFRTDRSLVPAGTGRDVVIFVDTNIIVNGDVDPYPALTDWGIAVSWSWGDNAIPADAKAVRQQNLTNGIVSAANPPFPIASSYVEGSGVVEQSGWSADLYYVRQDYAFHRLPKQREFVPFGVGVPDFGNPGISFKVRARGDFMRVFVWTNPTDFTAFDSGSFIQVRALLGKDAS